MLILILLVLCSTLYADSDLAKVKRVVDCDTFKLVDGRTVRALGIDCNESKRNKKLYKDAEQFNINPEILLAQGQIAYHYVKDQLEGKVVIVDCKKKDWFRRNLCYVYLPINDDISNLNFNKELVRKGYARAYRKYSKEFVKYEEEAKRLKLGMWR